MKRQGNLRARVITLDKVDLEILRTLQVNSKLTAKELGEKVNLSPTPIFERLKRLESTGYIKKYVAILDADKLNQGFVVYCNVKMSKINKQIASDFAEKIKSIPEVTECYNTSGHFDYLLRIQVPDMNAYRQFVLDVLGTVENLSSVESTFVMDEIKRSYGISL